MKTRIAGKNRPWAAGLLLYPICYFLPELFPFILMKDASPTVLINGLSWALLLGGICVALPVWPRRVFYAITYVPAYVWAMAQVMYRNVFHKMMWLTDMFYTTDGVVYTKTVLNAYVSIGWWICSAIVILSSTIILFLRPDFRNGAKRAATGIGCAALAVVMLMFTYGGKTDGLYTAQDIYLQEGFYNLTVSNISETIRARHGGSALRENDMAVIDEFFDERDEAGANEMTGALAGKNVVFVLMEALDDWLITSEETPTLYALQEDSIKFTDFYTPYYGTTRSINTQTCLDTGFFFPTNGQYFFGYMDNHFNQTMARQLESAGYTSQLFHHNHPDFYHRSELVPTMGYERYNSYFVECGNTQESINDCYLFDSPTMRELFFRDGPTLNFIATHSAHLPYTYDDELSKYALSKYPEYRGAYSDETEDCIRAKVRLVDDMFARLLAELEAEGQLENTVIIALSDHYPYGYRDDKKVLEFNGHPGGDDLLLENTPLFIWSADMEPMTVEKTINTSDVLPTLLNLLGIESDYDLLGRDAFDPDYPGYVIFPDGSWGCDGVLCRVKRENGSANHVIVQNKYDRQITEEFIEEMSVLTGKYLNVNNLILTTDYYQTMR